jgi:hypothetical protein
MEPRQKEYSALVFVILEVTKAEVYRMARGSCG